MKNEILSIMVDGGEQLCDHAIACWTGNKYKQDEIQRQEMLTYWKNLKKQIRPYAKKIAREITMDGR